jgi:hypothetical protein
MPPLEISHGSPRQRPKHAVHRQAGQRQQFIQPSLYCSHQRPLVANLQNNPDAGGVRNAGIGGVADVPGASLAGCCRDRWRKYRPSRKRRADRERDALLAASSPPAQLPQPPPLT